MKYDILVIGAGASGLMAAYSAAHRAAEKGLDLRVCVLEKMPRPGRKIMITGKGRCNFTNVKDWNAFSAHVRSGSKFLRSAFYSLPPERLADFFGEHGMESVIERGDRAYPASHRSADVVDALVNACHGVGVVIQTEAEVISIEPIDANGQDLRQKLPESADIDANGQDLRQKLPESTEIDANGQDLRQKLPESTEIDANGQDLRQKLPGGFKVRLADGSEHKCRKLIIATGGLSYPGTGSTGDGLRWARGLGHTVTPLFPSLTALVPRGYKEILRSAQDDRKTAQDDRKTAQDDRKTALDDKKAALDDKKAAQDDKKAAQDDRKTAQDDRKTALDDKKAALDDKKAALDDRERELPSSDAAAQPLPHHIPRETPLTETGQKFCGIQLKNIGARLLVQGTEAGAEFGDIDFTDGGIEGPLGFQLSRKAVKSLINGSRVALEIDLKPGVSLTELTTRVKELWEEIARDPRSARIKEKERCRILLGKLMPWELIPAFTATHPEIITLERRGRADTKVWINLVSIAKALKEWRFDIEGYVGWERAVVTVGGVILDEVIPKTMESRIVPGLYFCGEALDIDADTGGYNLQLAFCTGNLAGSSAAK